MEPVEQGSSLNADLRYAYWDGFYGCDDHLPAPSDFALFVHAAFRDFDCVVDIGCGVGRDAIFFANSSKSVVAIEKSKVAAQKLVLRLDQRNIRNVSVLHQDVVAEDRDIISELTTEAQPVNILLYGRFLLHALTPNEQALFLKRAMSAIQRGACLALEFRTAADAARRKYYPDHYRSYIDWDSITRFVRDHGVNVLHAQEGTGLARHRGEDPWVGRLVLGRRR